MKTRGAVINIGDDATNSFIKLTIQEKTIRWFPLEWYIELGKYFHWITKNKFTGSKISQKSINLDDREKRWKVKAVDYIFPRWISIIKFEKIV